MAILLRAATSTGLALRACVMSATFLVRLDCPSNATNTNTRKNNDLQKITDRKVLRVSQKNLLGVLWLHFRPMESSALKLRRNLRKRCNDMRRMKRDAKEAAPRVVSFHVRISGARHVKLRRRLDAGRSIGPLVVSRCVCVCSSSSSGSCGERLDVTPAARV